MTSGELTVYQKQVEVWENILDRMIPKMADVLPEHIPAKRLHNFYFCILTFKLFCPVCCPPSSYVCFFACFHPVFVRFCIVCVRFLNVSVQFLNIFERLLVKVLRCPFSPVNPKPYILNSKLKSCSHPCFYPKNQDLQKFML